MSKDFYTAVSERRSIYGINKKISVSDERIEEVIKEAVKYAPSAFNSQDSRVAVLFGENHNKLWEIARECLRKVVPPDQFQQTEDKIEAFKNGYGTVLFFEDTNVVESLQKKFPLYKDNFPVWAEQSNGMLQYIVWVSLETEGLGASLQHYNPLIDDDIRKQWNFPANWRLRGQMPFGNPISAGQDKEFQPIEDRFKIFK